MTPPPILGWWPPYPYLVDDPPPIVGWWPPHPYLADDPPTHTWLMTPLPILGWWPPYPYLADDPPTFTWLMTPLPILAWWPPYPYLVDEPPPQWLDDVLSQVGFSSVCVKAWPHETCAAGTSFHCDCNNYSVTAAINNSVGCNTSRAIQCTTIYFGRKKSDIQSVVDGLVLWNLAHVLHVHVVAVSRRFWVSFAVLFSTDIFLFAECFTLYFVWRRRLGLWKKRVICTNRIS